MNDEASPAIPPVVLRRPAVAASNRARAKHGGARKGQYTPEYRSWRSMRARCHQKSHVSYPQYGGRGIVVCDRWRDDFAAFLADMGSKPSPAHTIDRIDNAKGYEPGNCRWASDSEQMANRGKGWGRVLTHEGESLSLTEWAIRAGISRGTLWVRLKHKWPLARALSTPVQSKFDPQKRTRRAVDE